MSESKRKVRRVCRAVVRVGDDVFGCELGAPHPGTAHHATGWFNGKKPLNWCSDGEAARYGQRGSVA